MAVSSLKYKSKLGNLTAPAEIDLGGMIPIATVTVGSGGSSEINFTSIPQNYEHLQLRWFARDNRAVSAGNPQNIRFGNNGSIDTATNYASHSIYGNGQALSVTSAINDTDIGGFSGTSANDLSNTFSITIIDILDYTNTNKFKTVRGIGGFDVNAGSPPNNTGQIQYYSGLWRSTNALTDIRLFPNGSASYVQYSSFALYGIKRAGV
jgi:hypothetical protein